MRGTRTWWLLAFGGVSTVAVVHLATRGTVAVAPSPVWLAASFLVLAVAAVLPEGDFRRSDWFWAAGVGVVAGMGAGHVLLRAGFPYSHDGGTHLWALYGLYRAMDGAWIPGRWVPGIGLGIPLLLHHGPLPYLPGLVFMAQGMTVVGAFKATLIVSLIGSGATMYWAAKRVTGRRDAAVVAAMAYAFAPYHLLDTHYRGALGESVALVGLPIFLEAAVALITGRDRGARRRLVLAALWLASTHLMTLFTAAVGAGVAAALWWMFGRGRFRWTWVLPVGLGAALAGYWIVPAVLEIGHTSFPILDNSRPPRFGEHGIALIDLVWRRLWYGRLPSYQAAEVRPGTALEMPYYLGVTLLAGALGAVGAALGRNRDRAWWEVHLWVGLTLVAASMAWLPVARVLAAWPGFPKLQFAWRCLGIATAAGAMALACLVQQVQARLSAAPRAYRVGVPILVLAVAMFDFAPYTGAPDWVPAYAGAVHWYDATAGKGGLFRDRYVAQPLDLPELGGRRPPRVAGLAFPPARPEIGVHLVRGQYDEYLTPAVYRWLAHPRDVGEASRRAGVRWAFTPRAESPIPLADALPWARIETGERTVCLPGVARLGQGDRFKVTLPAEHPAGMLRLLEQANPGWEVSVDGGPWRDVRAGRDGLMAIPVEGASRVLAFRFGLTTWQRVLGLLVTLVALALSAALVVPLFRRKLDLLQAPPGGTLAARVREAWIALPWVWHDRIAMAAIGLAATGFRLWVGSLENGTDTIYGTAIRDLVVRGDWLAPSVHGTPYLMKPPLFFWAGAVFAHLFGLNAFALRLPAALGVVLAVVSTLELGRIIGGRRLGWFASALLLCSAPFFEFSRRVYMDSLLAGLTAASAVAWLKGLQDRRWFWVGGILSGLAVLTKSYAGLFAVLAFGGYLLLHRREVLKDWRLWAGLTLVVAIPAPWVAAELARHAGVFLSQNLDVFRLKNEAQFSWHPYREYFYFLEMWQRDPAFSLVAVLGFGLAVLAWWQGARRWMLPALWLVGPLALYCSLSQQRLYYLLPILPAAALFGGLFLERAWSPRTPVGLMTMPLMLLFVVNAAPSVAPRGDVLDPNPGLRAVAERAGALAPPHASLQVWNDFFAAPEFYSGLRATQLTPSRRLAAEIERILVVGRLGIVSFVQPPDGLWSRYLDARREDDPWVLLIQQGELKRLAPGLHGACVAAEADGWRLVMFPPPDRGACRPITEIDAAEDAYLAAARFFTGKGDWLKAADTMNSLARAHPESAHRAHRVAAGLYLQAGRPDLAAGVMEGEGASK